MRAKYATPMTKPIRYLGSRSLRRRALVRFRAEQTVRYTKGLSRSAFTA